MMERSTPLRDVATESRWYQDTDLSSRLTEQQLKKAAWLSTITLAYGSLGIIYGDIGTSPLYVFASTFADVVPSRDDVLGAISLIFWTLTLVVLVKYVGIVLRANDHGEGGTFSLYTLLCRTIGISAFGNMKEADHRQLLSLKSVSKRSLNQAGRPSMAGGAGGRMSMAGGAPKTASAVWDVSAVFVAPGRTKSKDAPPTPYSLRPEGLIHFCSLDAGIMRRWFRRSKTAQRTLLVVVVLANAMVIGDGVLTPAMSVLSAVEGLTVATDLQNDAIIGISVAILVVVFVSQSMGTHRISFIFSPVIIVWLLANVACAVYNLVTYGSDIFLGLSPSCAVQFLRNQGAHGWEMLGGIMLCITGAEAMFADLGHFSPQAVSFGFSLFVYPCIVLTYLGQGAYLLQFPENVGTAFYSAVPTAVFWPMLVIATLTSVVASQALITGAFSIIRQAVTLGVFPKLKVVHTGKDMEGQIYIPSINYVLLVLCIAVVVGFNGDSVKLGNAYGVAVMTVMFITTSLVTLVMIMAWEVSILLVVPFWLFFSFIEGSYLSATLIKVPNGGWFTLAVSLGVASIEFLWWLGQKKKREALHKRGKASISDLFTVTMGPTIVYPPAPSLAPALSAVQHSSLNTPSTPIRTSKILGLDTGRSSLIARNSCPLGSDLLANRQAQRATSARNTSRREKSIDLASPFRPSESISYSGAVNQLPRSILGSLAGSSRSMVSPLAPKNTAAEAAVLAALNATGSVGGTGYLALRQGLGFRQGFAGGEAVAGGMQPVAEAVEDTTPETTALAAMASGQQVGVDMAIESQTNHVTSASALAAGNSSSPMSLQNTAVSYTHQVNSATATSSSASATPAPVSAALCPAVAAAAMLPAREPQKYIPADTVGSWQGSEGATAGICAFVPEVLLPMAPRVLPPAVPSSMSPTVKPSPLSASVIFSDDNRFMHFEKSPSLHLTSDDSNAQAADDTAKGKALSHGARLSTQPSLALLTNPDEPLARLRGVGLYYSDDPVGIPPVMRHFLRNVEAMHEVVIFLTVRFLPLPHINEEERLLVRLVPEVPGFYQVVARYGYMDIVDHGRPFINQMLTKILHKLEDNAGLKRTTTTMWDQMNDETTDDDSDDDNDANDQGGALKPRPVAEGLETAAAAAAAAFHMADGSSQAPAGISTTSSHHQLPTAYTLNSPAFSLQQGQLQDQPQPQPQPQPQDVAEGWWQRPQLQVAAPRASSPPSSGSLSAAAGGLPLPQSPFAQARNVDLDASGPVDIAAAAAGSSSSSTHRSGSAAPPGRAAAAAPGPSSAPASHSLQLAAAAAAAAPVTPAGADVSPQMARRSSGGYSHASGTAGSSASLVRFLLPASPKPRSGTASRMSSSSQTSVTMLPPQELNTALSTIASDVGAGQSMGFLSNLALNGSTATADSGASRGTDRDRDNLLSLLQDALQSNTSPAQQATTPLGFQERAEGRVLQHTPSMARTMDAVCHVLNAAREGVVYYLSHTIVRPREGRGFLHQLIYGEFYRFMVHNSWSETEAWKTGAIPAAGLTSCQACLIGVTNGMGMEPLAG